MNNLHVRKGDTVVVLSGKDKGKQGKVISTSPSDGLVVVEGVNIVTRHQKPRRKTDPGGILKHEAGLRACKVMRVCPRCKKPTRAAMQILGDGSRARVCKKCGDII